MSVLSKLGKILSIAGPIAAIPFTGGASALGLGASGSAAAGGAMGIGGKILGGLGKAAPALGAIGGVAAGAAKGSANQRVLEGNQGLDYAQLQQQAARDKYSSDLSGANAQFGAGLQGAQFASGQQDRARKAAALQSLLSGMQDFKATPGNPAIAAAMGTSTGGARPSALTGNSAALMQLLGQAGPSAPTYTAPTPYAAPPVPKPPTAGFGEKALGGIGLGGSILGALGGLFQPKPPGNDMAGTVYNGVPELPWTLPGQPDPQNAYANPDELDPTKQRDPFAGVRF